MTGTYKFPTDNMDNNNIGISDCVVVDEYDTLAKCFDATASRFASLQPTIVPFHFVGWNGRMHAKLRSFFSTRLSLFFGVLTYFESLVRTTERPSEMLKQCFSYGSWAMGRFVWCVWELNSTVLLK